MNRGAPFASNLSGPLSTDSLTGYVGRYSASAGISKMGPCRPFRHTTATLMHEGGADLTSLQLILAHAEDDRTQICKQTSLRPLLDTHSSTHPAERPGKSPEA